MLLGVIPARGGSKGVLRKNIRPLCGKPLIAWTIEAAQRARSLDRFVVSTEDEEIARIARSLGAEVLPRPPELARDQTPTLAVLQQVLTRIDADTVVVLQPTSPIRDAGLIDDCVRRFQEKKADSLATGYVCKALEYGKSRDRRRQDIAGFFYDDGSVYVIRADLIRKGDRYGKRIETMVTDREQNVEIDDEFDFWLAEQVLLKRGASRGKLAESAPHQTNANV